MKRWLLMMSLILLTLGLSVFSLSAEIDPNSDNLANMARYYPTDTLFFASTRLDEAYINELDDLLTVILAPAQQFGIPPIAITQAITLSTGLDATSILGWLGDTAAVGIPTVFEEGVFSSQPSAKEMYAVVSLADHEQALAFLDANLQGFERSETADFILYTDSALYILVKQDAMFLSAVPFLPTIPFLPDSNDVETLLDTQSYQDAMAELPLDRYNILLYVDVPTLVDFQLQISQVPPNAVETNLDGMAIGFGTIDETNLVVDLVQLPEDPFMYDGVGQVNQTFLQNIPANASAMMQVSDYANMVESFIQYMDNIGVAYNEPLVPSEEFERQWAEMGIDLEADLLSWIGGDYVTFGHLDIVPIVRDALAYELELSNRFAWGMVMDTTANPEAASRFASIFGDLLEQNNVDDEISFRTETVAGVEATIVSFDAEMENPFTPIVCGANPPPSEIISFEMVLASNNEVFVFATRPLADAILSGNVQSIAHTPAYQQSSQYFLPDPTSVWFTTGEGFITTVGGYPAFLLALGPQIGCVFENILTTFTTPSADATPTPTPTPPPTPTPDFEEINQQVRILEYVIQTVQSSSITSTITQNGTLKIRAVLSYQAN